MNRAIAIYDVSVPFIPAVKRGLMLQRVIRDDRSTAPILPLNEKQEAHLRQILTGLGVL